MSNRQFSLLVFGIYGAVVLIVGLLYVFANSQLPGLQHNSLAIVSVWSNFYGSLLGGLLVSLPLAAGAPLVAGWWRKGSGRVRQQQENQAAMRATYRGLRTILHQPFIRHPRTSAGILPAPIHRAAALLRDKPLQTWERDRPPYDDSFLTLLPAAQVFLDAYDAYRNQAERTAKELISASHRHDRLAKAAIAGTASSKATYSMGVEAGVPPDELLDALPLPRDPAALESYVRLLRDDAMLKHERDAYIHDLEALRSAAMKLKVSANVLSIDPW